MKKPINIKRAKLTIKIFNILGIIFICFQAMGYMGSGEIIVQQGSPGETIGYFIGFNIFLWVALFFFYRAQRVKKKLNSSIKADMINSIGQEE